MCLQLADDGHDNECEEDKHEQNNNNNDDDDGMDDEGWWEGVADVRATSGATWLTSECGRVRCWASPLKIYLSFTTRLSQLRGGLLHFQSNQWTIVGLGGFWLNGTSMCVPRYM